MLAILALLQFLSGIAVPVFWSHETLRPLTVALVIATVAAIPLEEPALRSLPWQQRLRTRYGVIACAAWGLWLVAFAWSVVRRTR